jgi:hypothetical protein
MVLSHELPKHLDLASPFDPAQRHGLHIRGKKTRFVSGKGQLREGLA